MLRRDLLRCRLLAGLIGLGTIGSAQAQAQWPDHPIRFVVPFTPGGGTDAVSRNLADKLARETHWTFVVENKAGAGGNIGLDAVAKSRPDGYTVGMGQTSNLAINPAIMPSMPFDATADFSAVALVAEVPMVVVVSEHSPYRTLAELIAAAKAKPGELRQATPGLGTVGHLAGELLGQRAGYRILIVPYKGASPALTDLMGGQTDFMMATPQGSISLITGAKLRALAVTSARRIAVLPDVPTIAESGYPGFAAVDWKVVVAAAKTPPEVVERLNTAINVALKNPALIEQLNAEGSSPMGGTPEDARKYVLSEQAQWAKLIRESDIKF